MSTSEITQSITIDAPRSEVWRVLADFGGIVTWNPNVNTSKLTSAQPGGLGATRQCELAPMGVVQERITKWDEGRSLGIEVYEMKKMPGMRAATATFELPKPKRQSPESGSQTAESIGQTPDDHTEVSLTMTYEVGLGPIGATMNAMGMRRQFVKAATGLLAGLKHHVETGAPVDGKTTLPTGSVVSMA